MISTIRSAAAGLLLMTALAGCGVAAAPSGVASLASQGTSADPSAAPSASLDPEAAQLEFAKCMREHSVDMPDPETDGGGGVNIQVRGEGDRKDMEAAMDACNHFLEDAGAFRGQLDPAQLDKMVEFATCMREQGIDMPDPNADGGITFGKGGDDGPSSNGIDPTSDEFKTAEEACRPILGDFGPGGGPDSGPVLNGEKAPAKP
jgi:hypothetical protein